MLDYVNKNLIIETANTKAGVITWRSPSNIALIKYWGKHGRQLPQNPSVSLTLDQAYTETSLAFEPKTGADEGIALEFLFEDKPNEAFREKVLTFLNNITDIFPFLRQLNLSIKSRNSFPHSAGIASSASSMSALALCLCSLEDQFFDTLTNDETFRQKASFVARLGSGSACRSIYEQVAIWGKNDIVEKGSDLYAVPFSKTNEVFKNFQDAILLVSREEKSVSSRAGHALMEGNRFAENRYQQARQRFGDIMQAMRTGDLEKFGTITENEALTLHALMMTSSPSFLLMRPNSLHIIEKVRDFRATEKLPLYFTLDAGPNLHLLYPMNIAETVKKFIDEELTQHCADGSYIEDFVGAGPIQL